jgi:hypothetical protein
VTRARAAAVASDPEVEALAAASLADSESALDAVIAGFFAAGALHSGVLLSPISVLLGGVGEGAFSFDGRPLQPGRGTRRPRGFADPNAIPEAARVAVPTSLSTVLFAHAYGRGRSLRALTAPASALAKRKGAAGRAALLERIGEVGASALLEPIYRRPLLRVGSPSEGGLVTPRDLEPAELVAEPLRERAIDESSFLVSPDYEGEPGRAAAILAIDAQGVFAGLAYRTLERGIRVDELELLAPGTAMPVLRGVPRVSPGTRLGAGFAFGLRLDQRTRATELVFQPNRIGFGELGPEEPRFSLLRDPETRLVATRR